MMAIDRARSLLLVHDVVNKYLRAEDVELAPVIKNIERLLAAARRGGIMVAFAVPGQGDPAIPARPPAPGKTNDWGTAQADVPAILGPRNDEAVIRKPRYGAFYGSRFEKHMRRNAKDTVLICGLSLAGGVETTVRDADNRDLKAIVVSDACLCRSIPDQGWGSVTAAEVAKVALSIMAERFATVTTTNVVCKLLSA
jgi:ureidoacrylate peracid hydrolase